MTIEMLVSIYVLVVVIIVLAWVIVKEKQFLKKMLREKDEQHEKIMNLKLERVRLKHMIKMQDESISHLIAANSQRSAHLREVSIPSESFYDDCSHEYETQQG